MMSALSAAQQAMPSTSVHLCVVMRTRSRTTRRRCNRSQQCSQLRPTTRRNPSALLIVQLVPASFAAVPSSHSRVISMVGKLEILYLVAQQLPAWLDSSLVAPRRRQVAQTPYQSEFKNLYLKILTFETRSSIIFRETRNIH